MFFRFNRRGRSIPEPLRYLALAVLTGCQGCPPVQVQNVEAFQVAFLDNNEAIRVLTSPDGGAWTASDPANARADNGVGASASPDGAGLTRVLTHSGLAGRLQMRFGLGTTWDGNDVAFNAIQPHGRPTIIHLGGNLYFVGVLGGSLNDAAVLLRYDNTARQFTDVTPAGLPNLRNSMLHHPPALIVLPPYAPVGRNQHRIVMAYLRHTAAGSFSPLEVQTVAGDVDAAGNITWLQAVTYNFPVLDVGPPITEPALAHDQRIFYLALVRHYNKTSQPQASVYNLYVHSSSDGVTWHIPSVRDNLFIMPSGGFLEFAMTSDCKAVVAGIPITGSQVQPPKVYRSSPWPTSAWQQVPTANVFGANRPLERQFALITTGKPAQLPGGSCF